MIELDRGELLRLGAGGVVAIAAGGLLPSTARAGLPVPTPQDDDLAYFAFAAVAERASRDFYRAAHGQRATGLSASERRHVSVVAAAKRAHVGRIDAVLGADAPSRGDFKTVLAPGAVRTRARILALGARLETLLVRAYLTGIGAAADSATRLLLGRLLTYDAQALTWLQHAAGRTSPAGLLGPIELKRAGAQLDAFLATPDFPD